MTQSRRQFFVTTIIFILIVSISLAAVILNSGTLTVNSNNPPSPSPTPNQSTPTPTPTSTSYPQTINTPTPTITPTTTNSPTTVPTQDPTPTASPTETPVPTPSPMPTPDPASIIFNDNFQSGNMNAWTSTDTSGVNLSVKNQLLQCQSQTATNGSWGYLYKWLDRNYTSVNWRWYVFFGNLPATDGNIVGTGGIYNSGIESNYNPANMVCSLNVIRENGACYWHLFLNNASQIFDLKSSQQVQANTWYLVELQAIQGAGTGEIHFYLNNLETLNATGLTNNKNAGIDHVSIGGGITAGQPITWYCGGAVAAQTYVGPGTSPTAFSTSNAVSTDNSAATNVVGASAAVATSASLLAFFKIKKTI